MLSVFKNTQKNEWYLLAVKFYFLSGLSLKWNGLDGLRVNACNIDKQRGSAQNIYEWLLQLCESSAVCLWSLFNSCQISQHSWGWSGLLEFVLSGRTSRWLWISVRLFTRTCPRLFRYWYRVTLRVSRLTCTKCVLHMTLSQVNFHIIDYANLQELHVKWQHLVFFFLNIMLLSEIFGECRAIQKYLKYAEMLHCVCDGFFQATGPFWLNRKISHLNLLNMNIIAITQGKNQEEMSFHFVSHCFLYWKLLVAQSQSKGSLEESSLKEA